MMGFYAANFELPRPFRCQVRLRHVIDRQMDGQMDRHHALFYGAPFPMEVGDIITKC